MNNDTKLHDEMLADSERRGREGKKVYIIDGVSVSLGSFEATPAEAEAEFERILAIDRRKNAIGDVEMYEVTEPWLSMRTLIRSEPMPITAFRKPWRL